MKKINWLYLFIAVLFFLSLIQLFLMAFNPPSGTVATVYQDGTAIKQIDLRTVEASYTFTVTGESGAENVVLISPGGISVSAANCRDQICVHQGIITDGTVPIVCLPHRVVIQIGRSVSDVADITAGG